MDELTISVGLVAVGATLVVLLAVIKVTMLKRQIALLRAGQRHNGESPGDDEDAQKLGAALTAGRAEPTG